MVPRMRRITGETSRDYTVTIEATDEAGNTSSSLFNIVIENDLSGAAPLKSSSNR